MNAPDLEFHVYQDLRERLVDLTRRNRLLHFKPSLKAAIIRIVDEVPDYVLKRLQDNVPLRFKPLPEPDDEPLEERTPQFRAALDVARVTDDAYRKALAELDPDDPSTAAKEARIERELRDFVRRTKLGLPPRPQRRNLDVADHARKQGVEPSYDLSQAAQPLSAKHKDDWLQTLLFRDQLHSRLSTIFRNARSVEQETGVSTLHFAFGFLEWFESEQSEQAFSSPLLLLPVALERQTVRGGQDEFRLVALDDAPAVNLSLELRLRELSLRLPSFASEASNPVEDYFAAVAEAVRHRKHWRIRRFLTLAPFSFARIAMYRDLDPANWADIGNPAAHRLVRPVLRGIGDDPDKAEHHFADEYEIDSPEVENLAPILVHDADSSQHSAIIDAMQGKNLVIEGPPGTGKSQTIANLIANTLHRGATVLFVSEKMAALEVVKSRLDAVGLGHFCLAIHAAAAKPAAVVDALRVRESAVLPRDSPTRSSELQAQRARSELKAHRDTFHSEAGPLGETVHALVGRLAELGRLFTDLPKMLRSREPELPGAIDASAHLAAREKLEVLEVVAHEKPGWSPSKSPFRLLERTDLFPDEQEQLLGALRAVVSECTWLPAAVGGLAARLGKMDSATLANARALVERIDCLGDPGDLVDRGLLPLLVTPEDVEDGLWIARRTEELRESTERLSRIGLSDPTRLRAERLHTIASVAGPLGLGSCRVKDVPVRARAASAEFEAASDYGRVIDLLASVLPLGHDPDGGTVRLACSAARLAAEVDLLWHEYRRPGLERHASLLKEGATRQESLEAQFQEICTRFDLDHASPVDLRLAASALRRAGPFGFLRGDVRKARRLFRTRWREARKPSRTAWPRHLEQAAGVLADLEDLHNDAPLRAALGDPCDLSRLSLRKVALAAEWQCRVQDCLQESRTEAIHLRTVLVTLSADPLRRLAELAAPSSELSVFLSSAAVPDTQPWSALYRAIATRAAVLSDLGKVLSTSALPLAIELSEVAGIATTLDQWSATALALASPKAQRFLNGANPTAEALRATVEFAVAVSRTAIVAAPGLLADSWTEGITTLRASATRVTYGVETLDQGLQLLQQLGLRTFADTARREPLASVQSAAEELLKVGGDLPAYIRFATARAACVEDTLARPIVHAFETFPAPFQNLPEALDWLVAWAIVRRRAVAERAMFSRTGAQLSALRQSFSAADRDRLKSDARAVAVAASRRRVPPGNSSGSRRDWTDGALLQNEFAKQRRHIPVRDLLSRASDAIMAMTPCLMMSPLTVAQYLKPGRVAFDVVIMDEASQIKPEDAIGALLRGRQAVIVGDPKQLPPTNFFNRALDNGEEEEEVDGDAAQLSAEDRVAAESVLDIATHAFRPARRLRWHYRSRHESLIAFSNREFYDNDLVVFPAAKPPSEMLGVELVPVDGRWRERVNVEEAQAVASAVANFMRQHRNFSYGIVTMNQPQRDLIQAEIDGLMVGDHGGVEYREFWEKQLEPPFVKNLENVQGDERDVVFVSLGWGRTPSGAMHQRFFPVSRHEDGHRRLNVLFTRAKRKIVLFSSLRPEDIVVDPAKTAHGVRVLRDYLLYARDGRLELGSITGHEPDSLFEISVANALKARGHDIELQVGVAGYRIDLAVRHPEFRSHFVLGIECDGAAYHRAKSTRDRDRLRQEALERLGWRLTRVWSTDWFHDPAGLADRLSVEIEEAIRTTKLDEERRTWVEAPLPHAIGPRTGGAEESPEVAKVAEPQQTASDPPEGSEIGESDIPPSPPEFVGTPDLETALRHFREDVIMRDFPGSEPERCILRKAMVDAIIKARLDDPEDFCAKIPEWLRTKTDGRQMRYLERICDLVADSRP